MVSEYYRLYVVIFSNLVLVRLGRMLYIAFPVFYLGKGFREMGRGTTLFLKKKTNLYNGICSNIHLVGSWSVDIIGSKVSIFPRKL